MSVVEAFDRNGAYMSWGTHGKRYYFNLNSLAEKIAAIDLARRQGTAIRAAQYAAGLGPADAGYYHSRL